MRAESVREVCSRWGGGGLGRAWQAQGGGEGCACESTLPWAQSPRTSVYTSLHMCARARIHTRTRTSISISPSTSTASPTVGTFEAADERRRDTNPEQAQASLAATLGAHPHGDIRLGCSWHRADSPCARRMLGLVGNNAAAGGPVGHQRHQRPQRHRRRSPHARSGGPLLLLPGSARSPGVCCCAVGGCRRLRCCCCVLAGGWWPRWPLIKLRRQR